MCDESEPLPDLIDFNEYGNWDAYLEVIHEVFLNDFVRQKPIWPGKRFSLKRYPEHGGKSITFWHFISEGQIEEERLPDLRRCERIAWPRFFIDSFPDREPSSTDQIAWWKNKRGRETRLLLALNDFSYIVVMAERSDYIMPWTAYPVLQSHRQRKLEKEYWNYWNSQP